MLSETPKADRKIRDTEHTREMITSLWLIAENIGGWLGSFCGGIAYDHLGFEKSSLVIIGLQGIIIIGVPYLYYRSKSNERKLNAIVFDNVSCVLKERYTTFLRQFVLKKNKSRNFFCKEWCVCLPFCE